MDGVRVAGPACRTKPEALLAYQKKLKDHVASAGKSPSFTTYALGWMDQRRKHVSPTTYDIESVWLNVISRDPFGSLPINKIQKIHLEQWRDRQTLASVTLQKRLAFIRQILRSADNFATCTPPRKEEHHRRPLTEREITKLGTEMDKLSEQDQVAILLCWQMGLRRSEACGLRHEDRDGAGVWIKRTVIVTKDAIRVRHKGKNARSLGWVPIPPKLDAFIGSRKGFVIGGGSDPVSPKALSAHIKRVLAKIGMGSIPKGGTHAFRRTYGMTLLKSGVDVRTAADLMRHDPAMLLKEYSRSTEEGKSEAVLKAFGPSHNTHEINTQPRKEA